MFEWFYGRPEKKALKDWEMYKQVCTNAAADLRLKRIGDFLVQLQNAKSLLIDLKYRIVNLNLDVNNKFSNWPKGVKKQVIKNHSNLKNRLKEESAEYEALIWTVDSTRKSIDKLLGLEKLSELGKNYQQRIKKFHSDVLFPVRNLKRTLDSFVHTYDYIKYFHLSDEELEFYTRKDRNKTVAWVDCEVYYHPHKYFLVKDAKALRQTM